MSPRRLLDTNLILRHLTQDHDSHSATAGKLFARSDRQELTLVILPEVLAECVFVLASFYRQPRRDITQALGSLLTSPGIEIAHADRYLDALDRYGRTSLHFVDCVIAAFAADEQTPVATFDADLRKQRDIKVEID